MPSERGRYIPAYRWREATRKIRSEIAAVAAIRRNCLHELPPVEVTVQAQEVDGMCIDEGVELWCPVCNKLMGVKE